VIESARCVTGLSDLRTMGTLKNERETKRTDIVINCDIKIVINRVINCDISNVVNQRCVIVFKDSTAYHPLHPSQKKKFCTVSPLCV
jgi:hypothetical protein